RRRREGGRRVRRRWRRRRGCEVTWVLLRGRVAVARSSSAPADMSTGALGWLPARRLALLVEPRVEELPQALARDPFRVRDELRRRHVAVAVLRRPVADDPREGEVPDLLPQRLQRHPAAVVDRAVEEERRRARDRRRRVPERRVLGRRAVELLEPLRRALVPLVLAPDPLRPRRE